MKVALVHDFLIKNGGAERVLELLHQVFPEAPIYTLLFDPVGTKGVFSSSDYNIIESKLAKYPKFLKNRSKLLLPKFAQAIEEFDLSEYDMVISNSNSFAHGVITKPQTVHICYCHSPIRYLWDWQAEYAKENNIGFGLLSIYIRKLFSQIRVWDYYSSRRVDHWIANSKNVQKRIKKYYHADSDIIYPASQLSAIGKVEKNKDYYLILSRLSSYKKIDLAVEAFNISGKKLKVVGEGSEASRLKKMARENIEFLGYQSNLEVKKYLSECKALVFPGEEDFGLTPIEAMSVGRPVIAYAKGGVAESVINNRTGVFFENSNAISLNQAIDYFEKNPDLFKPEYCQKRANDFSKVSFINNFKSYVTNKYKYCRND